MPNATTGEAAQQPQDPQQPVDSAAQSPENPPAGGARMYTQEELDSTVKARIDKQNAKHRAELGRAAKEAQESAARAEAAEKKAADMEATQARSAVIAKAAADAHVSADVLARMTGETEEEIVANAALLAESIPKTVYPDVPDKGNQPAVTITKSDIDNIKDPVAQLHAIRDNKELFQ